MKPETHEQRLNLLESMILVRAFEDQLSAMVHEGSPIPGMQILSTGQEAAVGAVLALARDDVLVSNHRSHAHLLARGADPKALMAEIMGKATGVNQGKSGTLHLIDPDVNALMTSTVVGAGPPMAAGAAFAQQYREEGTITAVFFGDGAAAEGSVHEAMNLACVWKLPLLFVCENNRWAGAQPLEVHCAGAGLATRAAAYGMLSRTVDGNDADVVFRNTQELADHVRTGKGPAFLELITYRMHGHSESDPQHYVDPRELEEWRKKDPVAGYGDRLLSEGLLTREEVAAMEESARGIVEGAVAFAQESPLPSPGGILEHVWSGEDPSLDTPGAGEGG